MDESEGNGRVSGRVRGVRKRAGGDTSRGDAGQTFFTVDARTH